VRSLWSHQAEALTACRQLVGKACLVAMPVGSGKSEVIKHLALDWLQGERTRVVVAVPNLELAKQHRAGFILHTSNRRIIPSLSLTGYALARSSRLIITTYASLGKVVEHFSRSRIKKSSLLLIADECHHCNHSASVYWDQVRYFGYRVGFSATPWTPLNRYCFQNTVAYFLSLCEAQNRGIVARHKIEVLQDIAIDPTKRYQMYFVEDSDRFSGPMKRHGIMWQDEMGLDRPVGNSDLIQRFRDGEFPCLFVNRMLLEGFDCPAVKVIYIEKKTRSRLLAYQMFGRGLRRYCDQFLLVKVGSQEMYDILCQSLEMANDIDAEEDRWLTVNQ